MNLKHVFTAAVCAAALTFAPSMARAEQKDIVDTAVGAGQFTTLVKLVQEAGLVDTLKGTGPFTVFAPTDKAFAKLPKELVAKLTGNKKLLTQILTYHVVGAEVLSTSLKNGQKAKTVQGEMITVGIKDGKVSINKANVVAADVKATNGVIHVIDSVILPPSIAKMIAARKAY